MIKGLVKWLEGSALSEALAGQDWIVPAVQTVHLLGLALIFASMLMFDLRLLGVAGRKHAIPEMSRRLVPPVWIALCVMLTTGLMLIIAEPKRELENPFFWTKMGLLAFAVALTAVAQRSAVRVLGWGETTGRAQATIIGALTLACWLGIVFCGRWIAYYSIG